MRLSLVKSFALITLLCAHSAVAHDIPNDATVRAFVKPQSNRLELLVRVPLKVVRDLEFPETQGGYLDVQKLTPLLQGAAITWIADYIEIYEGRVLLPRPKVLATQISIESDRSFASYDEALAHVTGPKLLNDANVVWNQVLLDVLFEYSIHSDQSAFSIRTGFDRLALRAVTVLQFLPPDSAVRVYEFPENPGLIALDPRWHQAALRFVELGFLHILEGIDHLLFLVCLVIPFRRLRPLVVVITAFTIAHSITLIASACNFGPSALWFPPLIETLIAASIVYMALENIAVTGTPRRRWMMALGFGLIHGFGFSFALRETLQFAGSHFLASLLWFNIGVEIGQIAVLLFLVPLLNVLFRYVVAERMGIIILSALVAHTGWHWMIERWDHLRQFQLPAMNVALLRWALLGSIIFGIIWLLQFLRRRDTGNEQSGDVLRTQAD